MIENTQISFFLHILRSFGWKGNLENNATFISLEWAMQLSGRPTGVVAGYQPYSKWNSGDSMPV